MFASTQSLAQSSRFNENDSSWIQWIIELFQSNESADLPKATSMWVLPTNSNIGKSEVTIDPFKKHWEIIAFQNDIEAADDDNPEFWAQ